MAAEGSVDELDVDHAWVFAGAINGWVFWIIPRPDRELSLLRVDAASKPPDLSCNG